jgi:hypothetical protein
MHDPSYIMSATFPQTSLKRKRSLSRSVIKIIQRTLPHLVKSRRRSWTTNAKTRMPIDM